ncbi:hypothetical protein T08_12508 [Trichinella sp. T8]|nr:hypothetical protein T08_12508 [Trichinella sp. T8]
MEEGVAGEYRFLLGWREWRAGIQFCLGGGNGKRMGREFSVDGGGQGRRVYIFLGVEGIVTDLQFCLGG